MTPIAQGITVLLALGTLIADVAIALFAVDVLIGWLFNTKILTAFAPFRTWIAHHALELGFSVSLLALLGSLFFSKVAGFTPCELCWWVRICIYPQVVIFGLALAYQQRSRPVGPVFSISGILSALGGLISLYQYYGATFNAAALSACNVSGISCAKTYFVEFGYITIPVMSLTACILLLGIFTAIFAESGFFLGFFLPGDSFLFTVGLLAAAGSLNIFVLLPIAAVAAVAGDSLGYWTGATFGRALLERFFKEENRQKSWAHRMLKAEYLTQTEQFFASYGAKAIFLSRFVPIVRTFTPIFAGIAEMKYRTFLMYNVAGGVIWTVGFLIIAFYLGHIAFVQHYVSIIIGLIIVLSLLPIFIALFKRWRSPQKISHENN